MAECDPPKYDIEDAEYNQVDNLEKIEYKVYTDHYGFTLPR